MSTCGYVRYATRPSQCSIIARVTLAWRSRLATSGTRGPINAAHAREQLAFAVVQMLGDHRAVQVEIDAVDGPEPGEAREHLADDALVRIARNVRRR